MHCVPTRHRSIPRLDHPLVVDPGVDGHPVRLLEFGLVTRYVIGACYVTRMTEGEAETLNETEETHLNR